MEINLEDRKKYIKDILRPIHFYSDSIFEEYLLEKTDETSKKLKKSLNSNDSFSISDTLKDFFLENDYKKETGYLFEKYEANEEMKKTTYEVFQIFYEIRPERLISWLAYTPKRYLYYKELNFSKAFIIKDIEGSMEDYFPHRDFYFDRKVMECCIYGLETYMPELLTELKEEYISSYDVKGEPKPYQRKNFIVFLIAAYQKDRECLEKILPEMLETYKLERYEIDYFFCLILSFCEGISEKINQYAVQALSSCSERVYERFCEFTLKHDDFGELCDKFSVPDEIKIKNYLYWIRNGSNIIEEETHQKVLEYISKNTILFGNLIDTLMEEGRDSLAVTAYGELIKWGKEIPEKKEIWISKFKERFYQHITEKYQKNESIFVFDGVQKGDFSSLSSSNINEIKVQINAPNYIGIFDGKTSPECEYFLQESIFLLGEIIEIRNFFIILVKAYQDSRLVHLELVEHCIRYLPKENIYIYLYEQGIPVSILAKEAITCYVNRAYYSKTKYMWNCFESFIEEHKDKIGKIFSILELGEIFSDLKSNEMIYNEYLKLLYTQDKGYDKQYLVNALKSKLKSIVNCAEELLKSDTSLETKQAVEEIAKGKEKAEADAAMRLLRLWDNDKIGKELRELHSKEQFIEYIKNRYGKENEKNVPYPKEIDYSNVHFKGEEDYIPEEVIKFYVSEYILLKELYFVKGCNEIAKRTNIFDLRNLLQKIYEMWIAEYADEKYKNILFPYVLCAGNAQFEILKKQIDFWTKSEMELVLFTIQCIALKGDQTAFLFLDTISRTHKNKKVKKAALEALESAKETLGMNKDEFEDLMVSDLGFNKDREKIFSYGTRSFRAVVSPDLSTILYDGSKIIKSLPKFSEKFGDKETMVTSAKEELKAMKKQMKMIIDTQKLRMEKAIYTGRRWSKKSWEDLFINNPLMFGFATGLIWQEEETDGKVIGRFRYMEDGTFNTVKEEEYKLQSETYITLVHPAELTQEELDSWKSQLEDYEIIQPAEQLNLPVITEAEEGKSELTTLKEKSIYGASIKSIAAKLSCELQFGEYGNIEGFFCNFSEKEICFFVDTEPFYSGDYTSIVKIKRIYFRQKKSNQPILLQHIPKRLLSFGRHVEELMEEKLVEES